MLDQGFSNFLLNAPVFIIIIIKENQTRTLSLSLSLSLSIYLSIYLALFLSLPLFFFLFFFSFSFSLSLSFSFSLFFFLSLAHFLFLSFSAFTFAQTEATQIVGTCTSTGTQVTDSQYVASFYFHFVITYITFNVIGEYPWLNGKLSGQQHRSKRVRTPVALLRLLSV